MGRMTKTSRENIKVADRALFHEANPNVHHGKEGWLVAVERKGNRAYVSDAEGPVLYPTQTLARRAIRRVRPDLEPTEI
jgi:hypothetical protein